MPANKNQIRRIQTILKMMRQSKYPNFTSFMKEMKAQDPAGMYELSSKTFSRDIADLRDEYGAPLKYDPSRKGYYLTNPEWMNEDLMVEPFEMRAALLSERIASEIFPEPLRGEITKAVSSLLMKNETGMAEGLEMDTFQILCPDNLPKVNPEIFLAAYNAWENRNRMKLVYRSASNHRAEKLFEPHVFAWNGGIWYLKGILHRDNDKQYDPPRVQILALHRIEKAEVLPGQFWPDPSILKGVKKSGLFDFERIPVVEMEIYKPFDIVMAERFAATPGAIVSREDGKIRLHLENLTEYEALQLYFSTCANGRILAPDSLRKTLYRMTDKILENLRE